MLNISSKFIVVKKQHTIPFSTLFCSYKSALFCLLFMLGPAKLLAQAGIEILDYSTSISVQQGSLQEEVAYHYQINNRLAAQAGQIEIPYQQGEKLEILEAAIYDVSGNLLRKLKNKEITTQSAFSEGAFFQDSYLKKFNLNWHSYPYQIKYRYRRQGKEFLHLANWYPLVNTTIPSQHASLQVQVPLSYKVKFYATPGFAFEADTVNERCTYKWQMHQVQPVTEETFSAPLVERLPSVTVIPDQFVYGKTGSFSSWAAYGAWQLATNEGLDVLPLSEQQKVDELLSGIKSERDKVKVLYQYMQDHTHYINVSLDLGGLKPYPADYVCTKKYGDCKALTIYMKALLKHAGIASFYTKVYAGTNPVKIRPQMVSQQFNHVILCVPLKEDTLWLENTASYLPYNYLGTFTQNREVLMVGDNSKLIRTPALSLEEVLDQHEISYTLDEEGKGTMHYNGRLRGASFEFFNYLRQEHTEKEQLEAIKNRLVLTDRTITQWQLHQAHRDSAVIALSLEIKAENQFRKLGNSLVITAQAPQIPAIEKPAARKAAVRIHVPINSTHASTYHLPFLNQYSAKLPQHVQIKSKYGFYEEKYLLEKDQIKIRKHFQLFASEYKLDEYPQFWAFIEAVRKAQEKSSIILTPSTP